MEAYQVLHTRFDNAVEQAYSEFKSKLDKNREGIMKVYIGIDDTDIAGSPGTGFHARELAKLLEEKSIGTVNGITRHQLLIHPDIPYTSRNSSACLELDCQTHNNVQQVRDFCSQYLLRIAPEGSDIGLGIVETDKINGKLEEWGKQAKRIVLDQISARDLAKKSNVYLKGLTGTQGGVIGALAAIGLRSSGNDGRFIWLKGARELRDMDPGVYPVEELLSSYGISAVQTIKGEKAPMSNRVLVAQWTRPLLLNHKPVLIVEKITNRQDYEWKTLSKEHIHKIS